MFNFSLQDLKELLNTSNNNSCSFKVGEKYLIRCVTFFYTGRIKEITDTDLVLENAAWIASTGRFYNCLKDGIFNEVEPFVSDVIIPRGAIVDASVWKHNLPKDQK